MIDSDAVRETILTPAPAPTSFSWLGPSPYQFYLDGQDNLRVNCVNAGGSVRVAIVLRVLRMDGAVAVQSYELVPATDRTLSRQDFSLTQGFLLSARVSVLTGTPRWGQTFVLMQIIRGLTGGITPLATLIQGYITQNQDLAWPGSALTGSFEQGGVYRRIFGTDPAAGGEINEVVPTGAQWEPLALTATLVCSAAVATRHPSIEYDFGPGSRFVHLQNPQSVGASNATRFWWVAGAAGEAVVATFAPVGPMPRGIKLAAGEAIVTKTENIQPDDNWGEPILTLREWLDPS
jgi:hypothetical protein